MFPFNVPIGPSHLGLHCYLHHGRNTVFHVGEVVSIFQGGNGAGLPGWTNLVENPRTDWKDLQALPENMVASNEKQEVDYDYVYIQS